MVLSVAERLSRRIAEWVASLDYSKLPENVVEEVKKRVVDTFGVALGAYAEEPVRIARWIAFSGGGGRLSATLWGTPHRGPADHVVFANGCAARYFDFNDTYLSKEALHPSDTIPAVLAAAEIARADGKKVIEGIVASYEVAARLADAYSIRGRGWDHVVYIAIASAAGAAKVLGLDADWIEHAINHAVNNNWSLRQTRAGELSMWKGCAAANASRNGLFAAILAWRGMTGPSPVFEGEYGAFKVALCGDRFDLPVMGGEDGEPYKILNTSIKYWPVEYHAMSAVEAALKIVEKVGKVNPDDVEEIEVKTFDVAYKIIVKDPEKWDPRTRETADHSMPYIIAAALIDGKVWLDTFKPERYLAEDVRKLMKKMKVIVDEEHNALYPEGIKNTIKVKFKDGRVIEESSTYPPGHFKNPLDRKGVEEKFWKLVRGIVDEEQAREALKLVWDLENRESLEPILARLRIKGEW